MRTPHVCVCAVQIDDADTVRFKAASARLMGDMNDAGDAPFRGEVQLDSKARAPSMLWPP